MPASGRPACESGVRIETRDLGFDHPLRSPSRLASKTRAAAKSYRLCSARPFRGGSSFSSPMSDFARRFSENPLIRPADVRPSRDGLEVACVLNPGVFRHLGRTGLMLRVAERPIQESGWISTPVLDPAAPGGVAILRFPASECSWIDPARIFSHQGRAYLTTLSHLRLAWSEDGVRFAVEERPTLLGEGALEAFGIEDCRVTRMDDVFYLHYTAVSDAGFGVGAATTRDWKSFERLGMILPPPNKDFALFPEKIGGYYYALHRPTHHALGGPYIWVSRSPDLRHWGDHHCVARLRPGMWDGLKLGAGAEPIRTERGWLEIYHGVAADNQYCLGLLLFDLKDPRRVLARSREPILRPRERYELAGFFGQVVFTNGHVVEADGDTVTLYYGASDEVICGARLSIRELLTSLA